MSDQHPAGFEVPEPVPVPADEGPAQTAPPRRQAALVRGVAASAAIIAIGQLLSRLLGLVRQTVVADVFGSAAQLSVFTVVSRVPDMVYQLLLGGMVSAALVPVLSEYASRGDREELSRVTSTLLTLAFTGFVLIVGILEVVAPVVAMLVGGGFQGELQRLATLLTRLILPSLIFFASWGITAAVHYARQEFVFPAVASAVYNLGIILSTTLLARRLGVACLSVGVVLGSLMQLLIVLPGLRGLHLRPRFDLHHPALRRIAILYMPVIASLLVANLGIAIDGNLASRTHDQAASWMQYATYLFQLPLGLISVAIATAALPTLTRITDDPQNARFRRTLAGALRLVVVLIAPATIGLLVLGQAGIRTVLEHGAFTPFDTAQVTRALLFYLPGLAFAAVDQPIVFAFYARRDTVTPVLVGIAGVGAYLLVGPLLAFGLGIGYIGLVIANAVQLTSHCIILWVMLERRVGPMAGHGLLSTAARAAVSAGASGLAMLAVLAVAPRFLSGAGTLAEATQLTLAGAAGVAVYLAGLAALRVEELGTLTRFVRTRAGRAGGSS